MAVVNYTTVGRISFLLQKEPFSAVTTPRAETVELMINTKEDYIDWYTQNAFRETFVYDEDHDMLRSYYAYTGYAVHLKHKKIKTFDTTKGDKIEIFQGAKDYTDYLTDKTEGRDSDWWVDFFNGIIYFRHHAPITYKHAARITYRYGGIDTLINDGAGIDAVVTTVTVDSTTGFPGRGYIRIDDEEMTYTGKTATSFTGLTRGSYNSTAATHNDDALIVWVPLDIADACTKLVAIDILQREDQNIFVAEGEGATGTRIVDKIMQWEKDAKDILDRHKEMMYYTG